MEGVRMSLSIVGKTLKQWIFFVRDYSNDEYIHHLMDNDMHIYQNFVKYTISDGVIFMLGYACKKLQGLVEAWKEF